VSAKKRGVAAAFAKVVVTAGPRGPPIVGVTEFVVVALPDGMLTCDGIAYADARNLAKFERI
jgi:hypothetical protein